MSLSLVIVDGAIVSTEQVNSIKVDPLLHAQIALTAESGELRMIRDKPFQATNQMRSNCTRRHRSPSLWRYSTFLRVEQILSFEHRYVRFGWWYKERCPKSQFSPPQSQEVHASTAGG